MIEWEGEVGPEAVLGGRGVEGVRLAGRGEPGEMWEEGRVEGVKRVRRGEPGEM